MNTGVHWWSLSQARFIHSTPSYPSSIILSCHANLGHLRNDGFSENRLSYCLLGRLIEMFSIRYGTRDSCVTVMDIAEPHGVTLCMPLMVLEFIYCRWVPTVVHLLWVSNFTDWEIILFSGLFLGYRFPIEETDFFLQNIHPNLPWDHPAFYEYNEYRGSYSFIFLGGGMSG
jgi:hypothetical protein